jgi:NADH:ubiquinone oxidoreductase subunit E
MDTVKDILSKYPPRREYLLQMLHALQDADPKHALQIRQLEAVAAYLNVSKSAVFGVAEYYSMFSMKARAPHQVCVCNSPVCNHKGSQGLFNDIVRHYADKKDEVSISTCECLGHCEEAPSLMIGREYIQAGSVEDAIEKIDEYLNSGSHA